MTRPTRYVAFDTSDDDTGAVIAFEVLWGRPGSRTEPPEGPSVTIEGVTIDGKPVDEEASAAILERWPENRLIEVAEEVMVALMDDIGDHELGMSREASHD